MTAKILKFKKEPQIDPLALKAECVTRELKHQLRTLETNEEIRTLLLLVMAEVVTYIFSLNCFQDPRVTLSGGVNRLFDKWCKSKNKVEKESKK